jgi:hypothetical protein
VIPFFLLLFIADYLSMFGGIVGGMEHAPLKSEPQVRSGRGEKGIKKPPRFRPFSYSLRPSHPADVAPSGPTHHRFAPFFVPSLSLDHPPRPQSLSRASPVIWNAQGRFLCQEMGVERPPDDPFSLLPLAFPSAAGLPFPSRHLLRGVFVL